MQIKIFLSVCLLPLMTYGADYDEESITRKISLEDIEDEHLLQEKYILGHTDSAQSSTNQYLQGGVIYANHLDNPNLQQENLHAHQPDIIYSPGVVSIPTNVDNYQNVLPLEHTFVNPATIYGAPPTVQNSPLSYDKQLQYITKQPQQLLLIHQNPTSTEIQNSPSSSLQTQAIFTYNHDNVGTDQHKLHNTRPQAQTVPSLYYQYLQILQNERPEPEVGTYLVDQQQKHHQQTIESSYQPYIKQNVVPSSSLQYITNNDIYKNVPVEVKPHSYPLETSYYNTPKQQLYTNVNYVENPQVASDYKDDGQNEHANGLVKYSHQVDKDSEIIYSPTVGVPENHEEIPASNNMNDQYKQEHSQNVPALTYGPPDSQPHLQYPTTDSANHQKFNTQNEAYHREQSSQQVYAPKRTDTNRSFPYPPSNVQAHDPSRQPFNPNNEINAQRSQIIPYPPSFISITSTTPSPSYSKQSYTTVETPTPQQWQQTNVAPMQPNEIQLPPQQNGEINNYGRGYEQNPRKPTFNPDSIEFTTPFDFQTTPLPALQYPQVRPLEQHDSQSRPEVNNEFDNGELRNDQYENLQKPVKDLFYNREAKSLLDSYIPSWIVAKQQN